MTSTVRQLIFLVFATGVQAIVRNVRNGVRRYPGGGNGRAGMEAPAPFSKDSEINFADFAAMAQAMLLAQQQSRPAITSATVIPADLHAGVMYGVITSGSAKYRKQFEAVLDTWAARPRSEGRFLAVAGKDYPDEWKDGVIKSDCDDGSMGTACKEASLVIEAAKRNASWLFVVGEDNYVFTDRIESFLQKENADIPVGLGCIGCGKGSSLYGPDVKEHGGFCGGCGEAISYAALQRMTVEGTAALIQEYGYEHQCDMKTSAALQKRDVKLLPFKRGKEDLTLFGSPIFDKNGMVGNFARASTMHYVPAAAMRWLYAKQNEKTAELAQLEAEAFDPKGCIYNMNPLTYGLYNTDCHYLKH